jgi:hypothetical protein
MQERNYNYFFFGFLKVFSNTQEESEKQKLTWIYNEKG